jgi:hypothetical protein
MLTKLTIEDGERAVLQEHRTEDVAFYSQLGARMTSL